MSHIKGLIEKCNLVITFFDQLEDDRCLSNPEFNFRNLVKLHLKKLMGVQSDYWKQRCTIRWVQLSGENTKYFHARATVRYRHNSISSIMDVHGNVLVEHDEKAAAFLHCYKARMGVSSCTTASFNLQNTVVYVNGLSHLGDPFQMEEIEDVVKFLKPDKAP